MNLVFRVFILMLSASAFVGCVTSKQSIPSSDTTRTKNALSLEEKLSLEENWNMDQLEAHILSFNLAENEGRGSGTRGFLRTAAYVSAELELMGLQPIQIKSFRHQYASRIRILERASVNLIGRDTLQLIHGVDFLVADLRQSDQVQLSKKIREMIFVDGYKVHPEIEVEEQVTTSTQHVSGFLPGRHPVWKDSLILILAPLDGLGLQGPNSYTDGTDLGVAASALLELARRMADAQKSWSFFKPTLMVSFLSGSLGGCEGPENALRNLPWKKSYVSKVIVLIDSHALDCDWPSMISRNGLPSRLIELKAPLLETPEEVTMPFYPFVLRDRMIRTHGIAKLVRNAASLSEQAFGATLNN
ncbi:MAG: hypothetical protein O3B41_00560 [Bacteroidetes bacterium]|nr:hypothetical protein [Bacteroidota bacterium]